MKKEDFINLIKDCKTLQEATFKVFGNTHRSYNKKIKDLCIEFGFSWEEHLKKFETKVFCKKCGKEIVGKDKNRKSFCNKSCANSFNNEFKRHNDETKIKISQTLQKNNDKFDGVLKPISNHVRVKRKRFIFNKDSEYFCFNCGEKIENIYPSKDNKYCSNKCQHEFQHKEKYQKIKDGDESIMRANYDPFRFKPDILKEQNGICDICGCEPLHNGKELVFILDHIDGNAANNRRDNLRMVCPNCDTQLPTYKSKNKNGARHYYRYNKEKNVK